MSSDRFTQAFSIEDWFDEWRRVLSESSSEPLAPTEPWSLSLRRLVMEAMSDASPEQFLNALTASHLRHFGRQKAHEASIDRIFWVVTEWSKTDLSYGLASPFEGSDWNGAWEQGVTGDMGQIEVKVCYTHLVGNRIGVLADQLKRRRDTERSHPRRGIGEQRFYGLVWLFQHGGCDKMTSVASSIEEKATTNNLCVRRPFGANATEDDLGNLWPTHGGSRYTGAAQCALFELTP